MFLVSLLISIISACIFNIHADNLIVFYSSVLPFIFALIVGIKSILVEIKPTDYDNEKQAKQNINNLSEDIFKRLMIFFTSSLILLISLIFKVDKDIYFSNLLFKWEYFELVVSVKNFLFETLVVFSLIYFAIILLDIRTIIVEIIKLKNARNKHNSRG